MPPRLEIKTAPIQPRQGREAGKPQPGPEGNRFGAGFVAGATIVEPSHTARMTGATVAEKPSGITKMSVIHLGELNVSSSNISGASENVNAGDFKTHPSECTHGCRAAIGEPNAGAEESISANPSVLNLEVSSLATDQSDDKSAQEGTSALGACSNYGPDCKRNNSVEPTLIISVGDVKGGDGASLDTFKLDISSTASEEPADGRTSVFACVTRNSNNHNCC